MELIQKTDAYLASLAAKMSKTSKQLRCILAHSWRGSEREGKRENERTCDNGETGRGRPQEQESSSEEGHTTRALTRVRFLSPSPPLWTHTHTPPPQPPPSHTPLPACVYSYSSADSKTESLLELDHEILPLDSENNDDGKEKPKEAAADVAISQVLVSPRKKAPLLQTPPPLPRPSPRLASRSRRCRYLCVVVSVCVCVYLCWSAALCGNRHSHESGDVALQVRGRVGGVGKRE